MGIALLGHGVGAVLAHAHVVAVAGALDHKAVGTGGGPPAQRGGPIAGDHIGRGGKIHLPGGAVPADGVEGAPLQRGLGVVDIQPAGAGGAVPAAP